jgi:uncharacterized membrane protein YtjA (UPF0391 family)
MVKEDDMLRWSLAFLIVALFAASFGFGGTAAGATKFAQVLAFFFLVTFGVTLIYGLMTGPKPPAPTGKKSLS